MGCRLNETLVREEVCDIRLTARNVLKSNISFRILDDINIMYIRFDTLYRYNTYQKFPINLWENVCDYLAGRGRQYMINIMYDNFGQYITNHTCPFKANETLSFMVDKYYVNNFTFNYLVPSGDYRLNITYAVGAERNMLIELEFYYSVSDHRIWRFKK